MTIVHLGILMGGVAAFALLLSWMAEAGARTDPSGGGTMDGDGAGGGD